MHIAVRDPDKSRSNTASRNLNCIRVVWCRTPERAGLDRESTFAIGERQLVVQLAFETITSSAISVS